MNTEANAMSICTCKECKKITQRVVNGLCSFCFGEEENQFQRVKAFLVKNKNATVLQISKECKVSQLKIDRWIREGKLEIASNSNIKIKCRGCGKVIENGGLCNKCNSAMNELIYSLNTGAEISRCNNEDAMTRRMRENRAKFRFMQRMV